MRYESRPNFILRLNGLCAGFALLVIGSADAATVPAAIPANARAVVRCSVKEVMASAIARQNAEPLSNIFEPVSAMFGDIGIDVAKIQHIWLAVTGDYPRGTVIVVQGDFDGTRTAERLQQMIRDRKFSARAVRDGDLSATQFDIPVSWTVIPGIPQSIFLTVVSKGQLVAALDLESLAAAVVRHRNGTTEPLAELEQFRQQLTAEAGALLTVAPPSVLTGPGSIFAGVQSGSAALVASDRLRLSVSLGCIDANASKDLADRIRGGMKQVRQLFGPLAQQQNIGPRWTKLVNQSCDVATVENRANSVEVAIEITSEALKAILGK